MTDAHDSFHPSAKYSHLTSEFLVVALALQHRRCADDIYERKSYRSLPIVSIPLKGSLPRNLRVPW